MAFSQENDGRSTRDEIFLAWMERAFFVYPAGSLSLAFARQLPLGGSLRFSRRARQKERLSLWESSREAGERVRQISIDRTNPSGSKQTTKGFYRSQRQWRCPPCGRVRLRKHHTVVFPPLRMTRWNDILVNLNQFMPSFPWQKKAIWGRGSPNSRESN